MLIPSWGLEPLADRDVVALQDMGMVTGQRGGLGAEGHQTAPDGTRVDLDAVFLV